MKSMPTIFPRNHSNRSAVQELPEGIDRYDPAPSSVSASLSCPRQNPLLTVVDDRLWLDPQLCRRIGRIQVERRCVRPLELSEFTEEPLVGLMRWNGFPGEKIVQPMLIPPDQLRQIHSN